MLFTATLAIWAFAATTVFAVSDQVTVTAITSLCGMVASIATALIAARNRRDTRNIRRAVHQPRPISTDREAGVRVEPPEGNGNE